jgi:hypothetical protein
MKEKGKMRALTFMAVAEFKPKSDVFYSIIKMNDNFYHFEPHNELFPPSYRPFSHYFYNHSSFIKKVIFDICHHDEPETFLSRFKRNFFLSSNQ